MGDPIRTEDLTKNFGSTRVLEGLNLSVAEGSTYALIGSNGAGKTTTIKILMNIHRASGGSAAVLGVDTRRIGPDQFRRIGYVSENQDMPEWMTVESLLAYCRGFYPEWDGHLAFDAARHFRLPLDRKIKSLSRGMRMKAALVSSLAYRPRLIVLDEPFSGLDPLAREEFVEALLEWAPGATTLISSHDLADIESFSSHVGFLDEGRLQFSEQISDLSNRFREIEVTLEGEAKPPRQAPASWLGMQTAAAVVRFVDSRFDLFRTESEIREAFEGIRQVSVQPMPLRSIFVTLAKASRDAA